MSAIEHPSPEGRHPDNDTLAVVALGERADDAVGAHVASCAQCRAEVDSFARVVTAGRSLDASYERLDGSPPRGVWDRIAAELGIDPTLLPASSSIGGTAPARDAESARRAGAAFDTGAQVLQFSSHPRQPPQPVSAGHAGKRSRSWRGLLVAASVAGAIVGVGVTLGWQALDDPAIVASAVLQPLPDKDATGDVTLIGSGAERELNLRLDVDAPPDAYLQVWLMSPDAQRMVPVGVIEDGVGFWRVPAGLDITEFPLVDVSIEPFDGDAAHSSDSLVRGTLSDA